MIFEEIDMLKHEFTWGIGIKLGIKTSYYNKISEQQQDLHHIFSYLLHSSQFISKPSTKIQKFLPVGSSFPLKWDLCLLFSRLDEYLKTRLKISTPKPAPPEKRSKISTPKPKPEKKSKPERLLPLEGEENDVEENDAEVNDVAEQLDETSILNNLQRYLNQLEEDEEYENEDEENVKEFAILHNIADMLLNKTLSPIEIYQTYTDLEELLEIRSIFNRGRRIARLNSVKDVDENLKKILGSEGGSGEIGCIRGHQFHPAWKYPGYGGMVSVGGGVCVTLFSAANYCGKKCMGGCMVFKLGEMTIKTKTKFPSSLLTNETITPVDLGVDHLDGGGELVKPTHAFRLREIIGEINTIGGASWKQIQELQALSGMINANTTR